MEIGCRKCDQMLAQNVLECEKKVRPMSSNVRFRVSGGAGMFSNVTKMFINVGNWMSEMWSNVGPKCLGMWKKVRPMSSNFTFRGVSGGAGMLLNVMSCNQMLCGVRNCEVMS